MLRQTVLLQAAQNTLLTLEYLYPGETGNHRSVAVEITGPINRESFKEALSLVMESHETLRASIDRDRARPGLVIHDSFPLPFQELDATGLSEPPPLEKLPDTLKQLGKEKF